MLNHKGSKRLIAKRLVLRSFREEDEESMFGTWCNDKRVASHNNLNIGSGEVMKKIGMKHEGTLREQILRKDGSFGDTELYGVLKKEYCK